MTIEEEVQQQFHRAMAAVPFMLRYTTGDVEDLTDVSADEMVHGLVLLVIESLLA